MAERRTATFIQGLPLTQVALACAQKLHLGQRRDCDGAPFILHPLEVASLLYFAGAPDHVVAAGVLHDVIEETSARADDLRPLVGNRVTELVLAVSEDERIVDYAQRKAALRTQVAAAGTEALLLFAADKISKVRELRKPVARDHLADATTRRRLAHYRESLELLDDLAPDSPLVRRLAHELDRLTIDLTGHRPLTVSYSAAGLR